MKKTGMKKTALFANLLSRLLKAPCFRLEKCIENKESRCRIGRRGKYHYASSPLLAIVAALEEFEKT
jgi:hypothetical protein